MERVFIYQLTMSKVVTHSQQKLLHVQSSKNEKLLLKKGDISMLTSLSF